MPIRMTCPSCSQTLAVPDNAGGKKAKCPACSQIMIVPEAVHEAEALSASEDYTFGAGPQSFGAGAQSFGAGAQSFGAGAQGATREESWRDERQTPPTRQTAPTGDAERRPCPMCREMIVATAAKCRFCGQVFDPRARGMASRGFRGPAPVHFPDPARSARQIRFYFSAWWIGVVAAVALCAAVVVVASAQAAQGPPGRVNDQEIMLLVAFSIVAFLAGMGAYISYLILLYKLWATVQDGQAAATPASAVGFLFIPCFSIYWQFVAFWGLSKDLNRFARTYGIKAPEANESLALTSCILHCIVIIPYLGLLTQLIGIVCGCIALKGKCDVAVAIIESSVARNDYA
jgi:predicted RNA-binding Zn-ribbon protein involved in translation (DUF1610 family)